MEIIVILIFSGFTIWAIHRGIVFIRTKKAVYYQRGIGKIETEGEAAVRIGYLIIVVSIVSFFFVVWFLVTLVEW